MCITELVSLHTQTCSQEFHILECTWTCSWEGDKVTTLGAHTNASQGNYDAYFNICSYVDLRYSLLMYGRIQWGHLSWWYHTSNTHQVGQLHWFNQCKLHTAIKHMAATYPLLHRSALHLGKSISGLMQLSNIYKHSFEVSRIQKIKIHCHLTNITYHLLQPTTLATSQDHDLLSPCPVWPHHTTSSQLVLQTVFHGNFR